MDELGDMPMRELQEWDVMFRIWDREAAGEAHPSRSQRQQ